MWRPLESGRPLTNSEAGYFSQVPTSGLKTCGQIIARPAREVNLQESCSIATTLVVDRALAGDSFYSAKP